jgi:hypothetical protein
MKGDGGLTSGAADAHRPLCGRWARLTFIVVRMR